jgi:glycosyltransferase involved in cell wall biosynthesis
LEGQEAAHPPVDAVVVSVVIPAFNAAETLGEQIAALASQSWGGPLEVVVADNGSSDETLVVARQAARAADLDLKAVDASDHPGASHARNQGCRVARGDVVLCCDADDVVSTTWVEHLLNALADADLVGGYCSFERVNSPELVAQQGDAGGKGVHVALGYLPYAIGANFGAWRDVIEAVGGWNTEFVGGGDDIDFSWRAQEQQFHLGSAESAVVYYRLRQGVRSAIRQRVAKGEMGALLYLRYRDRVPARSWRRQIGTPLWLLLHAHHVVRSQTRVRWLLPAAAFYGRLRGSVRYRVWYL